MAQQSEEQIIFNISERGATGVAKTVGELRKEADELRKQIKTLAVGTEEYAKANSRLSEIMIKTTAVTRLARMGYNEMALQAKVTGSAINTLHHTLTGLSLVTNQIAGEGSKFAKVLASLAIAVSIATAIKQLGLQVANLRLQMMTLNSVMAVNPFAIAAGAIAGLISVVVAFTGATKESNKELDDQIEKLTTLKELRDSIAAAADLRFGEGLRSEVAHMSDYIKALETAQSELAGFLNKHAEAINSNTLTIEQTEQWQKYATAVKDVTKNIDTYAKSLGKADMPFGEHLDNEYLVKGLKILLEQNDAKEKQYQWTTAERNYILARITDEQRILDNLLAQENAYKSQLERIKEMKKALQEYNDLLEKILSKQIVYPDDPWTHVEPQEPKYLEQQIADNLELLDVLEQQKDILYEQYQNLLQRAEAAKKQGEITGDPAKVKQGIALLKEAKQAQENYTEAQQKAVKVAQSTSDKMYQLNDLTLEKDKLYENLQRNLTQWQTEESEGWEASIALRQEHLQSVLDTNYAILEDTNSTTEQQIEAIKAISAAESEAHNIRMQLADREANAEKQRLLRKQKDREMVLTGMSQIAQATSQMLEEGSEEAKAFATLSVLLDTAKAIMGITASMSSTGPAAPIAIAAGVAGVAAMGAAQIAAIWAAKPGKSSQPNTNVPLTQHNQVVATLDPAQYETMRSTRVYILDTDIAQAIDRVEVLDNETTF